MVDWNAMEDDTKTTIQRIVKSCVYGQLATLGTDGKSPKVRPVCAFLQDDFSILVPSHSETRKIAEIEANSRVEICFCDHEHWQVRFGGEASVVTSEDEKKRLVETTLSPKLWHGFFPEGEKDPRFVLYRIVSDSVEWMKEWELDYRRP